MKYDKNKNIIIGLLLVIVIILFALVILFATGTISFNSNVINTNDVQKNNDNVNNELNIQKNMLTESEAIAILKNNYNDVVRHIFNEAVAFCGTTDGTLNLNGFLYRKSTLFNNFTELESYLKKYMTDNLLSISNYNKSTVLNGVEVSTYYEKDGSLYCNTWNKGGNMSLVYYEESQSNFKIIDVEDGFFTATIDAVYYDDAREIKTTKKINVSVVKNDDVWLIDSYKEV